jgi:carboxyl-terminal processing protease
MVEELDRFSRYIPPRQLDAFEDEVTGVETGLGLRLTERKGRTVVLGPLPGSPAAKGGVLAGDVLTAVDEQEVAGLPFRRSRRCFPVVPARKWS